MRETFLLGKAAGEWLPLTLYKDALRRDCRLFEVPVAEMVKRCAQEQALPITEENASIFERIEGFLQFAARLPTPKIAIKIRMLMRRLFVHCSRMGASGARDSIFLGMVGNLGSNKMDLARMEGCNHWVGGGQPRGITPSVAFPICGKPLGKPAPINPPEGAILAWRPNGPGPQGSARRVLQAPG